MPAEGDDPRTPGSWELLRAIEAVSKAVEGVRDAMLTKERFDEYQRGTDHRFETNEDNLTRWVAESKGVHTELGGKVDAVSKESKTAVEGANARLDAYAEKQRESRGRIWLALGLTVAAVVLPRVWEILRGAGQVP